MLSLFHLPTCIEGSVGLIPDGMHRLSGFAIKDCKQFGTCHNATSRIAIIGSIVQFSDSGIHSRIAHKLSLGIYRTRRCLADHLRLAIAIEIIDQELGIVSTGTDILTQIDAPELGSIQLIAVEDDLSRISIVRIVMRIGWVPFQDDFVFSIPINIAAHIYLSLQELTAREISAKKPAVVTVGRFQGGQAPNIIPEEAVLEGTIRTFDRELSARIMERIRVIAENTAVAFRGSAQVEEIASAPPLVNDPALMEQVAGWAEELAGKERVYRLDQGGMGSEDFASFTYELPCAYLLLGAGTPQEDPRYGKPMHNEAVVFNEDVLPTGAALHTLFALRMLAQET